MSFFILPDEIIDLMCEYLDLQSKLNFYDTCHRFRRVLSSPKFIETCKLTFNSITLHLLQHDFFTDNKTLLTKLDVSGIDYMRKKTLTNFIQKFKNLVDLNISYTQILMPDCRDICRRLTNLRTICANFEWPKEFIRLQESDLKLYRSAFAHLDCLHFIGSMYIVFESDIVQHMVDQDRLRELRLTVVNSGSGTVIAAETVRPKFPFNKVTLTVQERIEYPYMPLDVERIKLFSNSNLDDWEMLLIKFSHLVFSEMSISYKLLDTVQAEIDTSTVFLETPTGYTDNYKIVMWLKTSFTKEIFDKVNLDCESLLPTVVMARNMNFLDDIHTSRRSCFICSCAAVSDGNLPVVESPAKRNRLSRVITNEMDVDKILPNTGVVEFLTLAKMRCACTGKPPSGPIRFLGDLNIFRNLKFLCLTDHAWYDPHFFKHLFSNCSHLATLNIQNDKGNYVEVIRYMNVSKSLRHFRLCQKTLDINNAIQGITKCPTLQVVLLFDTSTVFSNLPLTRHTIINLVDNGPKLIYLSLMSSISEAATKQQKKIFKECMKDKNGFIFLNAPGDISKPRNPYESIFCNHDYLYPENM